MTYRQLPLIIVAGLLLASPGCWVAVEEEPLQPLSPEERGTVDELIGTTWRVEDYTVTFLEPPVCRVKGGDIEEIAPDGVKGHYALEDGILEVSAMDETRQAHWYGDRLAVDGVDAVPQ